MPSLLIKPAAVVLPDGLVENQAVLCEDGRIVHVGTLPSSAVRSVDEVIEAPGCYLAPGLIDLHLHGLHQYRLDFGPDQLQAVCAALPRYGVTGFLPTLCSRPSGEDAAFLASLAQAPVSGAAILGFHLEGPFIALTGAMPKELLGKADLRRVQALIAAARPYPAIFSISPDFEGIGELLPAMRQGGPAIFMTHTAATVAQTQAAIAAGAAHATHFYDVFPCPPVTDPGVRPCGAVEAILADPRVTVDFILDGEHVDPVAVQMALCCKGPHGVCLITDANIGAGFGPGRYHTPHEDVEFRYPGGPARKTAESDRPGELAGSGLTMDAAVRNAVKMLKVNLPQAVRMASANPAGVLKLDQRKGSIQPGYDADMVLLDKSLQVQRSWVQGRCVYCHS